MDRPFSKLSETVYRPSDLTLGDADKFLSELGPRDTVEDFQRSRPGSKDLELGSRVISDPSPLDRIGRGALGGGVGALAGLGGLDLVQQASAKALWTHPKAAFRRLLKTPELSRALGAVFHPQARTVALLTGLAAGGALGAIGASPDSEEMVYGSLHTKRSQFMPEMNPTLALAKSLMGDTAGAQRVKTIDMVMEEQRQARREEMVREEERQKALQELHEARMASERSNLEQFLSASRLTVQAQRAQDALARSLREEQEPVENDLRSAMGLSSEAENSESDPDAEDAPSHKMSSAQFDYYLGVPGALKKHSEGPGELRQAGLVGYQQPEEDIRETYLEELSPTWKDRLRRGGIGAGAGALAGGLAATGLQRFVPNLLRRFNRPGAAGRLEHMGGRAGLLGAGLGLGLGAAAGAVLNRNVRTGYDTNTGQEVGLLDEIEAQRIFDRLNPGQRPSNFAVGGAEDFEGFGPGAPEMGYAVDLDEAISEDPLLAKDLLKSSGNPWISELKGNFLDLLDRTTRRAPASSGAMRRAVPYGLAGAGAAVGLGGLYAVPGLIDEGSEALDLPNTWDIP